MSGWIRIIVLGGLIGAADPAFAAAAEHPDPVELALRAEDYPRAEKLARAQLDAAERRHGRRSLQTLQAIDVLVDALLDGERIETPDLPALIEREIRVARELAGNDSREHARASARRAQWLSARLDVRAATTAATESSDIAARVLAANDPDRAEIGLIAAANLYQLQENPARRDALTGEALAVLGRPGVQRPRARAAALCLDAYLKIDRQDKDDALEAARACERYADETFGAHSARHAEALTTLGLALSEAGQYAEGTEALERSVGLLARIRPYRQRMHVEALRALAQRLGWLGDARGTAQAQRALAIEERHPTGSGYLAATLLNALAIQSAREDDAPTAQRYLERAIPIYERVLGADAPRTLRARESRAGVLLLLGRLDEAAAIYEQRIAAYAGNPAASADQRIVTTYGNLAYARLLQRRYVDAERGYRQAIALLGAGHDFAQINPRNVTTGLAAALWGQGRHREAFEQTRRVRESASRVRSKGIDQLSEREMLNFDYSLQDASELTVALATDSRDPALIGAAWQAVVETSGFVTRAMATRLALAASQQANSALWQEWRDRNAALSAARVTAAKAPSAQAIAALDRRQDELDGVERRIAALDGREGRTLLAERSGLDAVVAALPERSVLVRYAEISDYAPDQYRRGKPGLNARLYALVQPHGKPARAVNLGPLKPIAGQVEAWYSSASSAHGRPAQARDAARALRRALIDPLALDPRTQRTFVVPSSALSRINFAALVDEQERYLVDGGNAFHLLNHERELLLPQAGAAAGGVLLAGSASTRGSAATPASELSPLMRKACPGIDANLLGPLPGAASEIAALRDVAQGRVGRIDVLTGAHATETAVRDAMPGHSIIHLATHAFAFGDHCAGGETLRSIALDVPKAADTPIDFANLGSLSALAFLPQADDDNAHDGLLTSEEVATLDLSAADWVVLSACETALGKTQGSEGVFGLRRAFRLAGAHTVVMSLWKVDDEATAEFMQALYRARLVEGLDTPAAMRSAMQATREARRSRGQSTHPLYWAGFVAAGGWR